MREAAIVLAAAAAVACAVLFLVNGLRLRWWESEYGWYSQVALVVVGFLFVAIYAVLGNWPREDVWIFAALVPVLPMAVWRLSWVFRGPPRPPGCG